MIVYLVFFYCDVPRKRDKKRKKRETRTYTKKLFNLQNATSPGILIISYHKIHPIHDLIYCFIKREAFDSMNAVKNKNRKVMSAVSDVSTHKKEICRRGQQGDCRKQVYVM
jgi:hypothetical protein